MSGWMGVETAKKPNSIILKWLETTSCTDTLSMTTTINDTLLLVWRLFGQRSTGQTESSASSRTNWSDQFLQEIGQDINLQYALQQG